MHSNDPWKPNQTLGFNIWFPNGGPPEVGSAVCTLGCERPLGERTDEMSISREVTAKLRIVTFDDLE